jgi:hypothetical protein
MAAPQQPSDVQVQPNSTGQAIETVLVVQAVTGNIVGRQVMTIGDPNVGANIATVNSAGQLLTLDQPQPVELDVQLAILVQLRINNALMVSAFNLHDDLVKLEAQFIAAQPNQISGKAP